MREIMKASLIRSVLHILCALLVMWPLVNPSESSTTLKAYRDNAKFFTHWSKDNGLEMWGATVQARLEHPSS